jgi:hypothetical protein
MTQVAETAPASADDELNGPLPFVRILVVAVAVLAIVFLAGWKFGGWQRRNDRCEALETEARNAVTVSNLDVARYLGDRSDGVCGRGSRL